MDGTPPAVKDSRRQALGLRTLRPACDVVDRHLESLRRQVAKGEETLLQALDRIAPSLLAGGRPDFKLASYLDSLLSLNLRGYPWTRLLLGVALGDIDWNSDQARALVESADRSFLRSGDVKGQGIAALARGNAALGVGNLREAVRWWGQARELLRGEAPLEEMNLAHLSLGAYEAGSLSTALGLAEEALALARLRGHRRAEGLALAYLGFFSLNNGDFPRSETALLTGVDIFEEIPAIEDRFEQPLCHMALGALYALRGQDEWATGHFERAVALAESAKIPWYVALARAVRAEMLAHVNPRGALADARKSREVLVSMGEAWFVTWALRAAGVAARECGDLIASEKTLSAALDSRLNPIERGRTLLALGETLLLTPDPQRALPPLREARNLFSSLGMRYWLVRTLLRIAEADHARARVWRSRAKDLADNEIAYRRLFVRDLRVDVLGACGVFVGGQRISFQTARAELLVYALALAGERGLHSEELAERLWPGGPPERMGSRLRTTLWEARKSLGPESWRLQRTGESLSLDLEGASFDLTLARDSARQLLADEVSVDRLRFDEALALLDQELLPRWRYEYWVVEEEERRQSLLVRLRDLEEKREAGPEAR